MGDPCGDAASGRGWHSRNGVAVVTALLSHGLVSLREAISTFENVLFAGVPDSPFVVSYRKALGADLRDGAAHRRAATRLWLSVDRGQLCPWIVGGSPAKQLRLTPEMISSIPMLRETGGLSYLRPKTAAYKDISGWFGPNFSGIHLVFRAEEVMQCAKRTLRARRAAAKPRTGKTRGRPSSYREVAPLLEQIVSSKQWDTSQSMKRLAQLVNRHRTDRTIISEVSVRRHLSRLYAESGDRKFMKLERRRRKKSSG